MSLLFLIKKTKIWYTVQDTYAIMEITLNMLLRFRLKNALPSLVYTEMSLDAIAKNVGLYDKSRFCHAFSRIYGMTPSEYRHKNTANATKKLNYHKRRWRWIEDPDYDEQENTQ